MIKFKTIPMESNIGRKDNPAERRLCKDCKEFIDGKCAFLGEIVNKDAYCCSWYKERK